MGRSITQVSSATTLSARDKSLQNGTTKWLAEGNPRACYALVTWNTSSTGHGVALYDRYLQPIAPHSYVGGSSLYTGVVPHYIDMNSGGQSQASWAHTLGSQGNFNPTQGTPSSGSGHHLSGINAAGEFGGAYTDVYSNGTVSPTSSRSSSWNNKFYLNRSFINSDHSRREIAYVMYGGYLRAVSRVDGTVDYNYPGTKEFAPITSGSWTSMQSNGSYNNVRKEFIVFSYYSTGGGWYVRLWKGIDFDKYPSPETAFAAPGVTCVDSTISSTSSWQGNMSEAYYNSKFVLCDDGHVWSVSWHESNNYLTLYKYTRSGTDTYTGAYVTQKSTTTAYGWDSGSAYYHQKQMQSRDGGAVLCFCPYYYYACGMRSWLIDKRKSAYIDSGALDSSNSSTGTIPAPYGDSGFTSWYGGNIYTSSYSSTYMNGVMDRVGAGGGFASSATNFYLPHFPMPNTTNYPGFTHVVDYSMLDNQSIT